MLLISDFKYQYVLIALYYLFLNNSTIILYNIFNNFDVFVYRTKIFILYCLKYFITLILNNSIRYKIIIYLFYYVSRYFNYILIFLLLYI